VDEALAADHVRTFLTRTFLTSGISGLFIREFPLFRPPEHPSTPEEIWATGRSDLAFLPRWTGRHAPVRRSLGVEIKTRADSLTRLPVQAPRYHLFGRCLLATTPTHLKAIQNRTLLPGHWGLLQLNPEDHTVDGWVRKPTPVPHVSLKLDHLAEPIWRGELHALVDHVLEEQGDHRRRRTLNRASRSALWAEARTLLEDADLWNRVLDLLHARVHQVRLSTWAVPPSPAADRP